MEDQRKRKRILGAQIRAPKTLLWTLKVFKTFLERRLQGSFLVKKTVFQLQNYLIIHNRIKSFKRNKINGTCNSNCII